MERARCDYYTVPQLPSGDTRHAPEAAQKRWLAKLDAITRGGKLGAEMCRQCHRDNDAGAQRCLFCGEGDLNPVVMLEEPDGKGGCILRRYEHRLRLTIHRLRETVGQLILKFPIRRWARELAGRTAWQHDPNGPMCQWRH